MVYNIEFFLIKKIVYQCKVVQESIIRKVWNTADKFFQMIFLVPIEVMFVNKRVE